MAVNFEELLEAFDFVNIGGQSDIEAFVHRQSGKIYLRSPDLDIEDELPDDVDDDHNYVSIPHKKELGLGKPLVLNFVSQFMPDDFEKARLIFSRRGAYAAFDHLLRERGMFDQWHDFEDRATQEALREWCNRHSIALVD